MKALLEDLFKCKKREIRSYTIEYSEYVNFEWKTVKIGHNYEMYKVTLDNPYWAEFKEYWTGNDPVKCRKLINKLNKQWGGQRKYRLR